MADQTGDAGATGQPEPTPAVCATPEPDAVDGDGPAADHAEPDGKDGGRQRNWKRWLRIATPILIVVILAIEARIAWPHLAPTWHEGHLGSRLGDIRWWWVLACIVAALLSMDSYAQVQRILMRSAKVHVSQRESLAVILASNSISQTMPGGQVFAPAFIYRESRKWGASPVVASWQLVMSGLLAGVGLAILLLGGALLTGAQTNPFSVVISIASFIIFVVVMQYLASHPESLEGLGRRVLSWVNGFRDKPDDHGTDRFHRILGQLRAVHLRRRDAGEAFGWSLFNWIADVACLAFACYAIGAQPGFAALMVAYSLGKAAGSFIPLLPGGIGVVDAVLVAALVPSGMPTADAIVAVLIYRIISYLLVSLIGWVVIVFRYRAAISSRDDIRHAMEREEGDIEPGPATA